MILPQDPAFPNDPDDLIKAQGCGKGLTKRELFAAMAMQGIFASYANPQIDTQIINGKIHAKQAVLMADTLIAELNKEVEK